MRATSHPRSSPLPPQDALRPPGSPQGNPSPWRHRFTQSAVASELFPDAGEAIHKSVEAAGLERPPSVRDPLPGERFSRPLTAVQLLGDPSTPEPAGRSRALRLAQALRREVGVHEHAHLLPPALTPRAAAALAPPESSTEAIVASHQAILALDGAEVAPHLDAIDRGYTELMRQVSGHCVEQAVIVEYLRRHHLAAAKTAQALLGRLQQQVEMYEELRAAMDGSLLQRFQDSLGDAFAAALAQPSADQSSSAPPGVSPLGAAAAAAIAPPSLGSLT